MESHAQRVGDVLSESLSYELCPGASYVLDRKSNIVHQSVCATSSASTSAETQTTGEAGATVQTCVEHIEGKGRKWWARQHITMIKQISRTART